MDFRVHSFFESHFVQFYQEEKKGDSVMKCSNMLAAVLSAACLLTGCASGPADDKIQIEIVSYKPEAAKVFEEIQDLFNETHDDIQLTINSPNEAMTILENAVRPGGLSGYRGHWR